MVIAEDAVDLSMAAMTPANEIAHLIGLFGEMARLFEDEPETRASDDRPAHQRLCAAGERALRRVYPPGHMVLETGGCDSWMGSSTPRENYARLLRGKLAALHGARDDARAGSSPVARPVRNAGVVAPPAPLRRRKAYAWPAVLGAVAAVAVQLVVLLLDLGHQGGWRVTLAPLTQWAPHEMLFGVTWGEFFVAVFASMLAAILVGAGSALVRRLTDAQQSR
jgi:hypothetical protein